MDTCKHGTGPEQRCRQCDIEQEAYATLQDLNARPTAEPVHVTPPGPPQSRREHGKPGHRCAWDFGPNACTCSLCLAAEWSAEDIGELLKLGVSLW